MRTSSVHTSDAVSAVERQMRNWELRRGQRERQVTDDPVTRAAPFVALTRSVGSGGADVARALGERLGWPVFDRELLQRMAGDDAVQQRIYEHMDEQDRSWVDAALRWMLHGTATKDDYFVRLTETLLALHRQGQAVFLGRAADLVLPAGEGLRVRVVGSLEQRAERHALRNILPIAAARAEVERIDQERADFRRRHFGHMACDEATCDLVVNMDYFVPAQAVDLIVTALRLRKMLV